MWYYLVASFILTAQGHQAIIRQVGPFEDGQVCDNARRSENPALWVSDTCFDAFSASVSPRAPGWFGGRP